jgi:hypothetical protein
MDRSAGDGSQTHAVYHQRVGSADILDAMTGCLSTPPAAVRRPLSALVGAALLLLTMVAGAGGIGGFGAAGRAASAPISTAAAASLSSVPAAGDRRAAPALATVGKQRQLAGWAPHHPEPADAGSTGWRSPAGLVDGPVEAAPAVVALTIRTSNRGRAPPAGSLRT